MLAKLSTFLHSISKGWLILVLVAIFVPYILTTLPVLRALPGGDIVSLDARLFYSPTEAFDTVAAYGDAAHFWVRVYLTWDVINPIMYSLILSLFLSWLLRRGMRPNSTLQRLNLLPLGAGLFDLLENVSIVILLTAYPARPSLFAWIASISTVGKVALIAMSLVLVGVAGIAAIAARLRRT